MIIIVIIIIIIILLHLAIIIVIISTCLVDAFKNLNAVTKAKLQLKVKLFL